MSIKDLFRSSDIITSSSLESLDRGIESAEYIAPYIEDQERLIPHVDFADPANFAAYGSAQEYYKKSLEYVYGEYPYDGSLKEKIEWKNNATLLDVYIYDNRYPKSTGYITFASDNSSGTGWGANTGSVTNGYGSPAVSDYEYINFKGGPTSPYGASLGTSSLSDVFGSTANVWDADVTGSGTRESNLKIDLDTGVTVEFWFTTGSLAASLTEKQVIFDLWNNESSGSDSYGRFRVEVDGKAGTTRAAAPFRVTLLSGTAGLSTSSLDIGSSLDLNSFSGWKHYALSFINSGSNITTKLYVDGDLSETIITGSNIGEIKDNLQANIGALLTGTMNIPAVANANTAPNLGWGKLSGSIDEFRYWKVKRDSEQIGRHWFTSNLGGGTNTDFANTALGVYYKFNEGITTDSDVDSVVLDYSGRLTNGTWTGYVSGARNTGSAMVSASAGVEDLEPIIRVAHPDIQTLKTELVGSGSIWDYENNSSLYYTMPSWIIEEDEEGGTTGNLRKLTQILGTYFDNLQLQIGELSKLSMASYPSSSAQGELFKPYIYAARSVRSHGLDAPELFSNADVLEYFRNRNEDKEYEQDVQLIKSFIYTNIYNNLANIYKAKGTEKAVRNLIRCFGIDENLIRLNAYADNQTYKFETKRRATSYKTKAVDFNQIDRFTATVHQYADTSNVNSVSYISGSGDHAYEDSFPITMEAEVIFPAKQEFDSGNKWREDFSYTTASLFGLHTAIASSSMDGTENDMTWHTSDAANFQVYAIRDKAGSHDAYFKLTSSVGRHGMSIGHVEHDVGLTSSYYQNLYDNQKWNFAVRLKPQGYPQSFASGALDAAYTLEFYGVNYITDRKINEFTLTSSISKEQAEGFLTSSKRAYIGAHRTNFTGSTVDYTDVKVTSAKYWFDYVDDTAIQNHAIDPSSFGATNPSRDSYLLESDLSGVQVPQIETLALYWDFDTVTSSNASGEFTVQDVSSGSVADASRYDWIGGIVKKQHTARGFSFPNSSTGSVENQFLYAGRQQLPEVVYGNDNIRVLSQQETEVFTKETQPTKTYYAFEKSMYQVISDEILNYFASIKEFNNLIGAPVNRYRPEYKSLKYLRQFFFERVRNEPDLDKFIDYYKWIDATLEAMLMQLVPASAQVSDGIDNIVESHILERNKYWSKFPTSEFNTPTPETGALGINRLLYNWERGHRPLTGGQSASCFYWKERAERDTDPLNLNATGSQHQDATNSRLSIYTASVQVLERSYTTPYRYTVEKIKSIHGGINYSENKKTHFYRGITFPHGPTDSTYIPQNVLVTLNRAGVGHAHGGDVPELESCDDVIIPNEKKKYSYRTHDGRVTVPFGYTDGVKGEIAMPFNLISASEGGLGGYNKEIQTRFLSSSQLVNLHNDGYGEFNEVPMQGPFAEKYVGGHQGRHVRLNYPSTTRVAGDRAATSNNLDGMYTRPEAYRLLLGGGPRFPWVQPFGTGAIGLTGPDYGGPYPDKTRYRAWFFREETAKRPVNIRNILQTTSSVDTVLSGVLQHGPIGNYEKTYQIVQTSGRSTNNFWFNDGQTTLLPARYITNNPKTTNVHTLVGVRVNTADAERRGNTFIPASNSPIVGGTLYIKGLNRNSNLYDPKDASIPVGSRTKPTVFELPNRTKQDAVIVERFSAPGGPEINSLGFLDVVAAEKSVYNALPWRNLTVRGSGSGEVAVSGTMRLTDHIDKRRGLRTLLSLHANFGGTDGTYGSFASTGDYLEDPNFHKTNRNRAAMIRGGHGEGGAYDTQFEYGTASIYDNWYVQHPIPQNDRQYAWISSSLVDESATGGPFRDLPLNRVGYGHAPKSGMIFHDTNTEPDPSRAGYGVMESAGHVAAIIFLSGSQPDYSGATLALPDEGIPVDFVGLNTLIYDSTGSTFNILSSSRKAQEYPAVSNNNLLSYRNIEIAEVGTLGLPASGTIEIKTTTVSDLDAGELTIIDNFGRSVTYIFDDGAAPDGGASTPTVRIQGLGTEALIAQQLAQAITYSAGVLYTNHWRTLNVAGVGGDTLTVTYASASTVGNGLLTRKNESGATTMSDDINNAHLALFPTYGFYGGQDPDFGAPGAPSQMITFNALMLHRNGPYGYSSWRQVRNQEHSLVRQMRKNNTFSIIEPDSERSSTRAGPGFPGYSWDPTMNTTQDIYGDGTKITRDREVLEYQEPVVTFHSPMIFESDLDGVPVSWKATYLNQNEYFVNSKLNEKLRLTTDNKTSADLLMDAFGKGQIATRLKSFKHVECVYPAKKNIFIKKTRQRTSFKPPFWRDTQANRIVATTTGLAAGLKGNPAAANLPQIGAPSTDPNVIPYLNSQGVRVLSQSTWPLDGRFQADASSHVGGVPSTFTTYIYTASGSTGQIGTGSGTGELQNCQTTVHTPNLTSTGDGCDAAYNTIGDYPVERARYMVTASALYSRKHTLATGSSTLPWSSAFNIQRLGTGVPNHLPLNIPVFAGDAPWDAARQFGKNPFYDSYDEYVAEMAAHGREYSILPEFRMSDKINDYLIHGVDPFNDAALFALTGAFTNITASQQCDFYKVYSHSDFMKSFGVVSNVAFDKLKVQPDEFAVSCKGLLKLLPYDGFYPASRTLQIASLFSQSYGSNIIMTGAAPSLPPAKHPRSSFWRSIITPMFAPGLLYNSIKSGMAVDFPVFTTGSPGHTVMDSGSNDKGTAAFGGRISYCIANRYFDERLPFEALVEPESYIANKKIYDMEVHPSCSFSASNPQLVQTNVNTGGQRIIQQGGAGWGHPVSGAHAKWNGQGDARFKMAMNNFLAETPEFFLENTTLTSFFSQPQSTWKSPDKNLSYKMRVKLRKSATRAIIEDTLMDGSTVATRIRDWGFPQIVSGSETIVMYSRPSAFGPDVGGGMPDICHFEPGASIPPNIPLLGQHNGFFGDSRTGYNPAFTPAYYDGEAWADLEYNPGLYADEAMPSLDTLLGRITASYLRFAGPLTGTWVDQGGVRPRGTVAGEFATTNADMWLHGLGGPNKWRTGEGLRPSYGPMSGAYECNTNSNQVSSSVNLFGTTKGLSDLLKYDGVDMGGAEDQWVIQTKWETPILNFIDNSSSAGTTATGMTQLTQDADGGSFCSGGLSTRPIGMWHQYGRLPSGSEGIYMEIVDVPDTQRFIYPEATRTPMAGVPDKTGSLADLVGFSKASQRLGRVATSKTIREAVVAVPFIENNSGVRQFYSIDKDKIEFILSPPSVDVPPKSGTPGQSIIDMVEAMQRYNFPPSMDFVRYPDLVEPISMYVFEFEHNLNQQDLLNIWQNLPPRIARAFDPTDPLKTDEIMQTKTLSHKLEDGQLLNRIDDELQWMVFKVKQRAQTNYYDKVVQNNSSFNIPGSAASSVPGLMQMVPNIRDFTAGGAGAGGVDKREPYMRSYNWPYDFFSLVELAKIDDEVKFGSLQPIEPTTGTDIVFEAQTAVAPRGTRSYGAVTTRMVETLK